MTAFNPSPAQLDLAESCLPRCYVCSGPRGREHLTCDRCGTAIEREIAGLDATDNELDRADGHGWGDGRAGS